MNSFGRFFRLTTFGESHGPCVGGVIDGCPAGLHLDEQKIHQMLLLRKGKQQFSTERVEEDRPQFLSGILDGVTTGCPIAFIVPNKNQHSVDYSSLAHVFRPSHADFTYQAKYGLRDYKGGGRASARESVARVVAGAIAMQILENIGVQIYAYTSQVGHITLPNKYVLEAPIGDLWKSKVGCPIKELDEAMAQLLLEAKQNDDSLGGVASVVVKGVPAGWGSPLYHKLDALLASAMLGINACKGFEMGDGFSVADKYGSEVNDSFRNEDGKIVPSSNHSGGVLGGISDGAPILFRAVFKPIASISRAQETVDCLGNKVEINVKGRHDTSVFPRVLPIIKAMTALVLVDEYMASKIVQISHFTKSSH